MRRLGAFSIVLGAAILLMSTALTSAGAQKKKKPAQKPAPAASKALIAEGKTVYMQNGCAACHVIAGQGGKSGPDLSKFGKTHKEADAIIYVRNPKKKNPNGLMPAYGPDKINDKKLKALSAYLLSLK
jgi:mono/diheme cytochrome c family protein